MRVRADLADHGREAQVQAGRGATEEAHKKICIAPTNCVRHNSSALVCLDAGADHPGGCWLLAGWAAVACGAWTWLWLGGVRPWLAICRQTEHPAQTRCKHIWLHPQPCAQTPLGGESSAPQMEHPTAVLGRAARAALPPASHFAAPLPFPTGVTHQCSYGADLHML